MATNQLLLLLLIITITTATARPCKTIFYISSSTITTTTLFPNSNNSTLTALILTTTTTHFRKLIPISSSSSSIFMPMKLYASISDSVSERSNDVMSLVTALLFGIGCGALTAATIFFIWLLCSPRGYDGSDEEEKMVYVAIKGDDLNKENSVAPLAKTI